MRKIKKNRNGITLISLVVTIIILIILAGITIQLILGEKGIFGKAKEAKENYLVSAKEEQEELDKLYKQIDKNLPENTKENPQDIGKEVALKDGWGLETVSYINTSNGEEVKELTKVATVYAVSVGNGQTIPVPKGFWYVGGTLDNGVIISDNSEDRYGYNPETKKENDTNLDKTTHEYAPNLKGNQFVWIPCEEKDYHKTTTYTRTFSSPTWGTKSQEAYYDTSTNPAEKTQVEKYGGFYVARYEAGTSNIQGINFATITSTNWNSEATDYKNITSGNVTSKANEIPYYHTNYRTAVEMSERMYKNDIERNKYVNSGLITGTMWDVMINLMNTKTGCSLSESNWGNYYNLTLTNLRGYHCDITSDTNAHSSWSISDEKYVKKEKTRAILSTAASEFTQKMHLYDIAGNVNEWTTETAFYNNTEEWKIIRGGSMHDETGSRTASHRESGALSDTLSRQGFRVALYIK